MKRYNKALIMFLIFCLLSTSLWATPITINSVMYDVNSITKNGRTFLVLSDVYYALGLPVRYNSGKKEITIQTQTNKLTLVLNSTSASVNDVPITLSAAPFVHKWEIYVPLVDIANIYCNGLTYTNNQIELKRPFLNMKPISCAEQFVKLLGGSNEHALAQCYIEQVKNKIFTICNTNNFDYTQYSNQSKEIALTYIQELHQFKQQLPIYLRAAELNKEYAFTTQQKQYALYTFYALITQLENGLMYYLENGDYTLLTSYTTDCMKALDILESMK